MIEVAVQREEEWPEADWEAAADSAARAAFEQSPYAGWLATPFAIELSVRLTGDAEVAALNRQFRHKDGPTNVLSFPMVQPDLLEALDNSDDGEVLLGDIVLAHGVCAREARTKGISVEDHARHLIVHGVFHLLGYDHQGDADAEAMEAMEVAALASLGLADPYREQDG